MNKTSYLDQNYQPDYQQNTKQFSLLIYKYQPD